MMDIKSILGLKDKLKTNPKTIPRHVAMTAEGMKAWAAEHEKPFEEALQASPTLQQASARLEQARQTSLFAKAPLYLTL